MSRCACGSGPTDTIYSNHSIFLGLSALCGHGLHPCTLIYMHSVQTQSLGWDSHCVQVPRRNKQIMQKANKLTAVWGGRKNSIGN